MNIDQNKSPPRHGMKAKTIKAILTKKIKDWHSSINDEAVKTLVQKNTIVTGGCIASMLLGEKVNDFDIYFTDLETVRAVANYYVTKFNDESGHSLTINETDGRVKISTSTGHRGATAGDIETIQDPGDIEDTYQEAEQKALDTEEEDKDNRIVQYSYPRMPLPLLTKYR